MIKGAIQVLALIIGTASTVPAYFVNTRNMVTDSSGFVLVKKAHGIELYERWDATSNGEPAREVKAVFNVKRGASEVSSLIRDESKGMQWNKNACVYKVLEENQRWVCNIQYDLPWPVSNQDCVLEYREEFSDGRFVIAFNSIDHPSFPMQHEVIRIADVRGKWMLTKTDEGMKVEYFITTTPSETLPRWITDPIIRNSLLKSLVAFRTILEAPGQ
jgi:hypothetical protein